MMTLRRHAWADPAIQRAYEAALGDFLVRFNRIENAVDEVIARALQKQNRGDLYKMATNGQLVRRLESLELLMVAFPGIPQVPFDEIKELAKKRNIVAHGHFDQNPFEGDYQIVGKNKRHPITPKTIQPLAEEADKLWDALRMAEAVFTFMDVPIEWTPETPSDLT